MGEHLSSPEKQTDYKKMAIMLGVGAAALLTIAAKADLIDIDLNPFAGQVTIEEETIIETPEQIKIIEIEPIALDCRARTTVEFTIESKKESTLELPFWSPTYNTDTHENPIVGDIITCFEGDPLFVNTDTASNIVLNREDIRFISPRVIQGEGIYDNYKQGKIGKVLDALPWTDDNETLSEQSDAFAQAIIGSSECNQDAADVTEDAIEMSYVAQAIAAGAEEVNVTFIGEVDYERYELDIDEFNTEDTTFEIKDNDINCVLADDFIASDMEENDERAEQIIRDLF